MDETGNHHSQQTDTGTENQTPHLLSHKWEVNNENIMDTEKGTSYSEAWEVGDWGRNSGGWGDWEEWH